MENNLSKENKRSCKHWYYKKIIDDIFESNDKKKLEDILNEIAIYFGKPFTQQLINNIPVCKMFKFFCEEMPNFEIYAIQYRGFNYLFYDEDSLCSCNERLYNNDNYFCQHLFFFKIMKYLKIYSTNKISLQQMNEIFDLKYSKLISNNT